ncbi:MAG TPA: hypothetical protein VGS03_21395 [Candidatus Polarisedimenticolia bacterium]|nr:hypothetical protein [Candidatus Polarisedimenticolia bacterium]
MKKKKTTTKKKKTAKKKSSARRRSRKAAPRLRVKARARRKVSGRTRTKPARSSRKATRPARSVTNRALRERGPGPGAAGQSGDTEGLSGIAIADSESVKQLVEEGQPFEAGIISGVENAPDADKGRVRTRQVPEDDVPQEYLDED